MIQSFYRVKGPGCFRIEEFQAITGLNHIQANECLQHAIREGKVIRFGDLCILKPTPALKNKSVWIDWKFSPQKQKNIWNAISKKGATRKDISKSVNMSDTALGRYLRAMVKVKCLSSSNTKPVIYKRKKFQLIEQTYQNLWKKKGENHAKN